MYYMSMFDVARNVHLKLLMISHMYALSDVKKRGKLA